MRRWAWFTTGRRARCEDGDLLCRLPNTAFHGARAAQDRHPRSLPQAKNPKGRPRRGASVSVVVSGTLARDTPGTVPATPEGPRWATGRVRGILACDGRPPQTCGGPMS